jgi:predicted secreted protein
MRRGVRALGLVAALAGPAAADYTHDRVIGFSEDGRYFAFETYGLQRGSGLPFAKLFVVDLDRDARVQGSPIRARAPKPACAIREEKG